MPSRREYVRGLMAVGGVGAAVPMAEDAAAEPTSFSAFVERDGTELVVDGEPFYFNGANAPWLTHTYPSRETVDRVMAFASDLGLDVLRTGIHSVDVGGTVHSPQPGELGEEAFQHVDYVLQQAERHGIRMVFSLVDNWDYYGGMDAYVSHSSTASSHDDFYTDDQCRQWYREYVRKVLTRENTLTGRQYRNDPTIAMWELANEAEAKQAGVDVLQSWTADMAAYFESVDGDHLVSTGSGGNYNTDSSVWEYSGGHGVDYVQNHRVPEIDVCSFHLYPEWLNENTNEYGQQWIRDHVVDAHETIGKPVFLGEFGWAKGRTPSRASVYADWFDLLDQLDAAGAAAWQLIRDDRSETSKHDVRPSDTGTTNVLADFAATQRAKGTSSGGGSDSPDESSLAGQQFRVEGAGSDVWNRSDEFHFVHEGVSGDATLVARVAAQEATDPWAKAGLMLRDSLADDAAHAMVVVTPDNGIAFQHRDSTGGWTAHSGVGGGTPQLLKLERRGDVVTGYASTSDGWVEVGSATLPATDPRLGLAVTSHAAGTLSTARFEEISGRSDARRSTWANDDVGAVDVTGSARTVDGTLSVVADPATGVDASTATLNAELVDLGGADAASVSFEWGVAGDGFPNATEPRTLDAPGAFGVSLDGLASETTYEFRAVAETDAGSDASDASTFTTDPADGGDAAPTVDGLALQDRSNPAWTRYGVDWAVSDADGDLASVTVELVGADGSTLDSATTDVGGGGAAGNDELRTKGSASEVRLTVTDAAGNGTTEVAGL